MIAKNDSAQWNLINCYIAVKNKSRIIVKSRLIVNIIIINMCAYSIYRKKILYKFKYLKSKKT